MDNPLSPDQSDGVRQGGRIYTPSWPWLLGLWDASRPRLGIRSKKGRLVQRKSKIHAKFPQAGGTAEYTAPSF